MISALRVVRARLDISMWMHFFEIISHTRGLMN
jgi:hypothetical protein